MEQTYSIWISAIAVMISFISFGVTFWQRREADRTGIQPALVLVFDDKIGWRLQNIGNGPALNVVVAIKQPQGKWLDPVRVPPIAKDAEFELHWIPLNDPNGLGATYTDIRNRPYATTSGSDYSRLLESNELPEVIEVKPHPQFKDHEIRPYWILQDHRFRT
jgi:hypothetical protein